MSMEIVGITGGSGYIGSSIARHLLDRFSVRILDIQEPPSPLVGRVDYRRCDVRDYGEVERGLEGVDLVIHTAIVQIPLINENRKMGFQVNLIGTQNICKAVDEIESVRGLILSGSWHVFGERGLRGVIDEEFGFRPDKVEERARLYALSKIAQETIVRFYDEMSGKIFGVIRMGTVLGEGMPEKTAANIFISRGVEGKSLTPYQHTMYRPMLYVDIKDICRAFTSFTEKILGGAVEKSGDSLAHIFNVAWPEPITIIDLAQMIQRAVQRHSGGRITPLIEAVETGQTPLFSPEDKAAIKIDNRKALDFLGLHPLTDPETTIDRLVREKIQQ
jgi:UDP-glucose 4-epimerase